MSGLAGRADPHHRLERAALRGHGYLARHRRRVHRQGRSHAVRLAQEGADIIAVDLGGQVGSVPYPMATPGDLAQTVKEVEALGRRVVAAQADVRDYAGLKQALDDGVAQGRS